MLRNREYYYFQVLCAMSQRLLEFDVLLLVWLSLCADKYKFPWFSVNILRYSFVVSLVEMLGTLWFIIFLTLSLH